MSCCAARCRRAGGRPYRLTGRRPRPRTSAPQTSTELCRRPNGHSGEPPRTRLPPPVLGPLVAAFRSGRRRPLLRARRQSVRTAAQGRLVPAVEQRSRPCRTEPGCPLRHHARAARRRGRRHASDLPRQLLGRPGDGPRRRGRPWIGARQVRAQRDPDDGRTAALLGDRRSAGARTARLGPPVRAARAAARLGSGASARRPRLRKRAGGTARRGGLSAEATAAARTALGHRPYRGPPGLHRGPARVSPICRAWPRTCWPTACGWCRSSIPR